MWFIASKIFWYLALPPASLLIIMATGLLIMGVCRRTGKFLTGAGLAFLYLFSITPVSDALLRPLESYTPPLKDRHPKAEAIVVLGGGVRDLSWVDQPPAPFNEAAARLMKGVSLYRNLRIPLVLVGGSGDPSGKTITDADTLKRLALDLGVPSRDILIENRSRNTIEGARALNKIIRGRRILLVTSAYHLKRAAGMFKKEGFQVTPVPAVFLSEQRKLSFFSLIPRAGVLYASSAACGEYLSLLWYTATGKI